jgi:drug/metabolite transporter (DMT)-like permease
VAPGPSSRTPAILAIITAAVLFGTAAVPAKKALERMPPFVLAELRWIIALGIILAVLRHQGRRPVFHRIAWPLGLTGLTLFYFFYSYGLRHTTAANATLIAGGTPVIVALLAALFLHERITVSKAFGIAASMAGIAVIVLSGTGLDSSLFGNLLIVGSATSWAVYTVLGRHTFAGNDSLAVLAGIATAGLIQMAPLAVYESYREGLSQIHATDFLYVVYLALGPSAAAYMLVGYALTHLEASQAAVFGNIMPFAGALAGYIFLGEQIGLEHLIGGAFIILGVWLATRTPSPRLEAPNGEARKGSVG